MTEDVKFQVSVLKFLLKPAIRNHMFGDDFLKLHFRTKKAPTIGGAFIPFNICLIPIIPVFFCQYGQNSSVEYPLCVYIH